MRLRYFVLSVLLLGLLVGFQNCGKVAFSNGAVTNASAGVSNPQPQPQPTVPPKFTMSPADLPALVGWYSYTPNTTTSNSTSNPPAPTVDFTQNTGTYSSCPAVTSSKGHGQVGEYCYEPSGANGMYFGNGNNQFSTLTKYIFNGVSGTAQVVPSLENLFSNPAYQVSQNQCFVQGLFYYALAYLMIPQAQDLTSANWDVQFSLQTVDDGVQFVSNGQIVGNAYFSQAAKFSLNKGQSGNLSTLKNGANTLVALWVDDCASQRYIKGDSITYTTTGSSGYTTMPALAPNVLRGYIYSISGQKIIAGASVSVAGFSATTDSSGYFQIAGIPDGIYAVSVVSGNGSYTEQVPLNHTSSSTAIVDFTRGL